MATAKQNKEMNDKIKEILEKEKSANIFSQESVLHPGGRKTLLRIEGAAPLPPRSTSGRPSMLETLAWDCPDIYAEMIHDIKMCSYPQVAGEAIGIPISTFKVWLKNGRNDIVRGEDSFYSRFYGDIRVASAIARKAIEQAYAIVNPAKWLAHGPGRMFGRQWSEGLGNGSLMLADRSGENGQIGLDPIEEEMLDEVEDTKQIESSNDGGMTVLNISPADELATLEAQEIAGHMQVSEEYKDSLRRQIQKP